MPVRITGRYVQSKGLTASFLYLVDWPFRAEAV